jgi:histidine ammonia-lyase
LQPAPATGAVVTALREAGAPAPGPDRFLAPEIETAVQLVASGAVVAAAESATGPLN